MFEVMDDTGNEVEDFMCDQVIFSTEAGLENKRTQISVSTTRRVMVEIFTNNLVPKVSNVYSAYLRNQRFVIFTLRRVILQTVIAALANYLSQSLSSVQKRISSTPLPIKTNHQIKRCDPCLDDDETPEKCVECNILNIHDIQDVKTDIIFVHGLHGGLYKTWRRGSWRHERHKINKQELVKEPSLGDFHGKNSKTGMKRQSVSKPPHFLKRKISKKNVRDSIDNNNLLDEECSKTEENQDHDCWPLWLEKDRPGTRVIALNYTTDPYLWRPLWVKKRRRTGIVERSKEMIDLLIDEGIGSNPIVWVGHSKGGLYIKQILLDCSKTDDNVSRNIYAQTKAILFYSVPHRGSIMADFNLPLLSRSIELTEVQKNCQFVLDLHDRFLKLFQDDENFRPEIFSFIETSFTLMSFIFLKIVSFESADPGIGEICGVPLDHREICKPAGKDCFLYRELLNLIDKVLHIPL